LKKLLWKNFGKKQTTSSTSRKPAKNAEKFTISSLSCLYIEDQVDSQILFKVQMKELKDIKFAVSFEEALPLLSTFHFDFLVIDINLQGEYNGLDALRIIHKMPGLENIPIIAVTAYVLPGDREKFIASGFNDFISKPIFHAKLIDVLGKIFTT
jgi:CheY-like chemotaxis protein